MNGEVSPCCYDFNTELSLGNIQESTLQEIIDGPVLRKLRDMQEEDSLRNSNMICGDCDQLYSREDALVYTTNKSMRVGKHSLFSEEDA